MQILLACAKIMADKQTATVPSVSCPRFQEEANYLVSQFMNYSAEELQEMLKCNKHIARICEENYQSFYGPSPQMPAILAYAGIAYKHLRANDFREEDFLYAQDHLWITSFLYGLLRPLDPIKHYRLEGGAELLQDGIRVFDYWRPRLTDALIEAVQNDDGVLVYLASEEMKSLFDWKKVSSKLRIIYPEFKVRKHAELKTIVVYTKICRGAMTRFIVRNKLQTPGDLNHFEYEGFTFSPEHSSENHPLFCIE